MVDIAPKALRFARLAAEQQPEFANDPEILVIRRHEDAFRQPATGGRAGRYIEIAEGTADFCVRAVASLLAQPSKFETSHWDGNDFSFLEAVATSLRQQLTRPQVHGL